MAVTSLGTHKIEKIYINNNEYFLINSFVTTNIINTNTINTNIINTGAVISYWEEVSIRYREGASIFRAKKFRKGGV